MGSRADGWQIARHVDARPDLRDPEVVRPLAS